MLGKDMLQTFAKQARYKTLIASASDGLMKLKKKFWGKKETPDDAAKANLENATYPVRCTFMLI